MSAFVVGLTGGIGSGKSTVADLLVARGAALVDSDAIAHELTGPGGSAMAAIGDAFGAALVGADGALDRGEMRRRVFADPALRRQLEAILHPMIRAESLRRCQAAEAPYVVLAVPLLIESGGFHDRVQRVLVVDCPEALQVERVSRRNALSDDEVRSIMAAQATRQQRLDAADDVVLNDGAVDTLAAQVDVLHHRYLELAGQLKASR